MISSHLPLVINRDNTSKRLFQYFMHIIYYTAKDFYQFFCALTILSNVLEII